MSYAPTDTADVSPDDLRQLAALLEKHDLTELRYEQGDVRVTLRTAAYFRQQGTAVTIASNGIASAAEDFSADVAPEFEATDMPDVGTPGVRIEAPIMGVFYRSASPTDPPFVEIGDSVEVGQAVGLIEAMKVFSEVRSESAGVVREIPATNKALVQPGDALIILDAE
ncbi:MAG: hypothetical protein H8F28_11400 [Fibrella sp.]|nr:hypothetical protein [Armatimonadota bacterium]